MSWSKQDAFIAVYVINLGNRNTKCCFHFIVCARSRAQFDIENNNNNNNNNNQRLRQLESDGIKFVH